MNRFQPTIAPVLPNDGRAELRPPAYEPEPPRNFEELKVSHSLLWDLMLRHLRMQGSSSFRSLSGTMKVSTQIVQLLFEEMRQPKLLHIKGTEGFDYSFELTDSGRRLAAERSERSRYTGPVPVSLDEYSHAVRLQIPNVRVNRAALKSALSDLVVPDSLLDQLGPAVVSQRSLFLYVPTGNGKTSYS